MNISAVIDRYFEIFMSIVKAKTEKLLLLGVHKLQLILTVTRGKY